VGTTATTLADLLDRAAVIDLSFRYATAIDTRDWALLRTCFCDEVDVDFSSFTGRPAPGKVSAEDWVAMVRGTVGGLDHTQHLISNQVITLDGDVGRYRAYVQAQHVLAGDGFYLVGGTYDNEVRRDGDGWRLSAMRVELGWAQGDPEVMRRARRRLA
jgi:3-phenylpropionate/cinnamic acid dioxygenase small subunit